MARRQLRQRDPNHASADAKPRLALVSVAVATALSLSLALILGPLSVTACNALAGYGDFERVDGAASPTTIGGDGAAADGGAVKADFFLGPKWSCSIMGDYTLRCWGANNFGQLGIGGTEPKLTPVTVPGLANVTFIALGESHMCAVLNDGSVWCWGSNDSGQLGIGPPDTNLHDKPARVGSASPAKKIQAGRAHTCIETLTKMLECWGANQNGQLGDGTTVPKSLPQRVPSLSGIAKASIGGGDHTCAVAKDVDGGGGSAAYCWGLNDKGQLGQPTSIASTPNPMLVPDVIAPDKVFIGRYHSCAMLPDTTVKCWGANELGQLGDGTQATRSNPAPVSGVVSMTEVGSGNAHICGVERNSALVGKCWGSNEFGQLGLGTVGGVKSTPQPLAEQGWEAISARGEHACGRRSNMNYCWGRNDAGQLGNGTTTDSATPVQVKF